MKKNLYLILAGCLFTITSLYADDQDTVFDFIDYAGEKASASETKSQFSFTVEADAISKTKINKGFYKGEKFEFCTGEAELGMAVYYDEDHEEAISLALDYSGTLIDWEDNPWFDQKHFNIVTLSVAGTSERIHNWLWRGQVNFNMDANEFGAGCSYSTYDILLWGRYKYCRNIGINVGIIVETGMRTDRVYPILGVDWKISNKWQLNLVFPVNVSLEYSITKAWILALEARSFSFRDRVGRHEANARSVLRYQNIGAELAIKYSKNGISFNVHGGSTLGGKLRIADSHNHHPRTYHFDPSAYAGAELTYRF